MARARERVPLQLHDENGSPFMIRPISAGLLEKKHQDAIGPALWLFLCLLRAQTNDSGQVLHGNLLTLDDLAGWIVSCRDTAKDLLRRLCAGSYVYREDLPGGFRLSINRPKTWRYRGGRKLPLGGEKTPPPQGENSPPDSTLRYAPHEVTQTEMLKTLLNQVKTESKTTSSPAKRANCRAPRLSETDMKASKERQKARVNDLLARYDSETKSAVRDAIARCMASRQTKTIALTLVITQLEWLEKYDPQDVLDGTDAFLKHPGHVRKPENYWRGCVRSTAEERQRDEENQGCE